MRAFFKVFLVLLTLNMAVPSGYGQSEISLTKSAKHVKTTKILMVLTSFGEVKSNGKKTGTWLEEFAAPYYALTDQGVTVTIASPKGGKAPIDPKSLLPDYSSPEVKRFLADTLAQAKLNHTLPLNTVSAKDYQAVFYPGGHGPMWDLPDNPFSIRLIMAFYQAGKPVALVCHGPAALKNVKTTNGNPLISGKKVTGFANTEELAGQSTDMAPFSLEDMLKASGATYEKGEDWKPFVVSDGLLITGQNPASAEGVAQAILTALREKGVH